MWYTNFVGEPSNKLEMGQGQGAGGRGQGAGGRGLTEVLCNRRAYKLTKTFDACVTAVSFAAIAWSTQLREGKCCVTGRIR